MLNTTFYFYQGFPCDFNIKYEINDARTFLFAVEADEEGNEITADEEYQQKMTDLMIKKAEEAEAVSKETGKK